MRGYENTQVQFPFNGNTLGYKNTKLAKHISGLVTLWKASPVGKVLCATVMLGTSLLDRYDG